MSVVHVRGYRLGVIPRDGRERLYRDRYVHLGERRPEAVNRGGSRFLGCLRRAHLTEGRDWLVSDTSRSRVCRHGLLLLCGDGNRGGAARDGELRKGSETRVRCLRSLGAILGEDLEGRSRRHLTGGGKLMFLEVKELAHIVLGITVLDAAEGGFLEVLKRREAARSHDI